MSSRDFEDLYGVTQERALNFWVSHLQEAVGSKRWSQMRDSTGIYLASLLGHFCLQSMDRIAILSPDYKPGENEFRQFADLTQIAEMMLAQLTSARNPLWMESAGAHILLYAGFFQRQNRGRHNIDFYSRIGRDCYLMVAVGRREPVMKQIAAEFNDYLVLLANLHIQIQEKRYLIQPQNN